MRSSKAQLVEELNEQIRRLEGARHHQKADPVISTGLAALDRCLPGGGLRCGSLLEWLCAQEGGGATSLALLLAARVQERGGLVVVIDDEREFYPPVAHALGISLSQTVVIQPALARDGLWVWEQALRSTAVSVVLGALKTIHDRTFRRLQLAAEEGGSIGLLLRPERARAEPSWATARFLVEALPSGEQVPAPGRRLRIEALQCRGGKSGQGLEVELCHEENAVRLVPAVARSAAARKATGA
jgi:protein ImuA